MKDGETLTPGPEGYAMDGYGGGNSYVGNAGCMGTPAAANPSGTPQPTTWTVTEPKFLAKGINSPLKFTFPVKFTQFKRSAEVLLLTEKNRRSRIFDSGGNESHHTGI